jgi:hypothetical protein
MFRHFDSLVYAAVVAAVLAGASSGAASAASPTGEAGSPIIRVVELNSWYRAVLVDREATRNPRDLEALAKPLCEGMTVCRVGVWIDEWTMPNGMPVRASQLEAQEYAFGRNPKGEETSLWNCNKYPEFEAEGACLPRVLKQ